MKSTSISANFLTSVESGGLKVPCNSKPPINFWPAKDSRIIDIIDIPIILSKKNGLIKQLSEAKDLARNLKHENITLEVRLHGKTILMLEKKINPKLAQTITLSNNIEIKNLKKLKKLSETI
jgi:hypothetical protein